MLLPSRYGSMLTAPPLSQSETETLDTALTCDRAGPERYGDLHAAPLDLCQQRMVGRHDASPRI
jgi:hypothetical protein